MKPYLYHRRNKKKDGLVGPLTESHLIIPSRHRVLKLLGPSQVVVDSVSCYETKCETSDSAANAADCTECDTIKRQNVCNRFGIVFRQQLFSLAKHWLIAKNFI